MRRVAIFLFSLVLIACATRPPSSVSPEADSSSSIAAINERRMDWRTFSKPGDNQLKTMLTPLQYEVTQEEGTERPFDNEYWDEHREGIYVDVVSGEPLFSSLDKFDSGTGWPSFTKPLVSENIATKEDNSLLMSRTEVRSTHADSHLGHLFHDGPKPTGLRYCMNSASMRFIPKESLALLGYDEYEALFHL